MRIRHDLATHMSSAYVVPIYLVKLSSVLRIWIRDPGSNAFCPLDPGSGIGFFRIPDPGS